MQRTTAEETLVGAREFYCESMALLRDRSLPFLVGGAYAMSLYTGIKRETKDFDLYVRARDVEAILEVFREAGHRVEKTYPHWLAKIFRGNDLIDLIFRAGNGLCEVDDSWFRRARTEQVLGVETRVCAPEEMIWMKSYIMERERYDGADIAHLLESCADELDWKHLLVRFADDWRVLFSHLVLFGFIYPTERHRIPPAVIEQLTNKLRAEQFLPATERVCRGTLLSRAQFLADVRERGLSDARLEARCGVTPEQLEIWTADAPQD